MHRLLGVSLEHTRTLRCALTNSLRPCLHACYSTRTGDEDASRIRNIGIIAHIDAGKTTTTERMLHYAGFTRKIGGAYLTFYLGPSQPYHAPINSFPSFPCMQITDVDTGSTVMDYLPQERDRGITINSAAITFGWRGHKINLIDTPGHVDFTIEVERSVRVLDGAVTILDAVAGVEAQTETVWLQAGKYGVPRIAYINKMDRVGAGFGRTVREIWLKLNMQPITCQIPVMDGEAAEGQAFQGVVDLVEMEILGWSEDAENGTIVKRRKLEARDEIYEEAVKARTALVEVLSELDDRVVEVFLELGDHALVPSTEIKAALRRVTLANKGVPILCGASFRNMGVQPLMDAVLDYLPSPLDRPAALAALGTGETVAIRASEKEPLCALAFKVTHDARRGPMVFVRVYAGRLDNRATLYNSSTQSKERVGRLLQMYAKDVEEIQHLAAGNIGVVLGLKETRTGDTLIAHNDPQSSSGEKALHEALGHLMREDPSLHVHVDQETSQTLVSGMGELHLEIVRDRLVNEFRVLAEMGRMRISYRESCSTSCSAWGLYDRELLGKKARAEVEVEVIPFEEGVEAAGGLVGGNRVEVGIDELTEAMIGIPDEEKMEIVSMLRMGLESGLSRGGILGFPLTKLHARVKNIRLFAHESTPGAIAAATSQAVAYAVKQGGPVLLEPLMDVSVECREGNIGNVVSDLSGVRRGQVLSLDSSDGTENQNAGKDMLVYAPPDVWSSATGREQEADLRLRRTVRAHVPLSNMIGYSSALRSLTGGQGSFAMSVIGYGVMSGDREREVVKEMGGA